MEKAPVILERQHEAVVKRGLIIAQFMRMPFIAVCDLQYNKNISLGTSHGHNQSKSNCIEVWS